MRFFKLKALSCSGKGNRVLRKKDNEVLQEGAFHDPDALMARGYIYQVDADGNPIDGSAPAVAEEITAPGESALAAAAAAVVGEPGEDDRSEAGDEGDASPVAGKSKDDFKKAELQALCDAVGLEYDDKDTKADLLKDLKDHYGDNA